jgi:hypothetical protein
MWHKIDISKAVTGSFFYGLLLLLENVRPENSDPLTIKTKKTENHNLIRTISTLDRQIIPKIRLYFRYIFDIETNFPKMHGNFI